MNKQITKSEYDTQAENFLQKHGITFSARFLFHGPHWEGDKDNHDVYELSLTRDKGRAFSVRFGQSQVYSRNYWNAKQGLKTSGSRFRYSANGSPAGYAWGDWIQVKPKAPSAYDMLACLTKYDPGSFEDFCSEYGYDTDSRKAEKTYHAVQKEWYDVSRFFSADQLAELQEIN